MFLGERVDEFATRVADAHRMRDECEAALLFRFYVRSMPTSDVRTLNELQVQQLLTRAQSARLRAADIPGVTIHVTEALGTQRRVLELFSFVITRQFCMSEFWGSERPRHPKTPPEAP